MAKKKEAAESAQFEPASYKVRLTFLEELLGTAPKDKELYDSYIAGKSPNVEETADEEHESCPTADDADEKGQTGFHRMPDGTPMVYDYTIKGFFKDACSMLSRCPGTKSKELRAFKKVIDGLVFIRPRKIPLILPEGATLGRLQRPLRAQTAQGERVALACSESAPPGTEIEFTINILGGVSKELLEEWLEYGTMRGMGQWRNASFGSFESYIESL